MLHSFAVNYVDTNGKCSWVTLRGPIAAEAPAALPPPPPGFKILGTEDNPIIPKTQADIDSAPPGTWIKNPRTGKLFIQPLDYEKVRKVLQKNWPELTMISLISNGGSVSEAMKIGWLIRKYLITTYVPKNECGSSRCVCASACALIWLAGIERMGTVGLHRPRIDDPEFASQPPEEATKIYRSILNDIQNYLEEMEVPEPIIQAIVATSSSEICWVDAIDDQLSRPPSYAEWEDASCHEPYDPEKGPFVDQCRGSLRLSRVKKLSPPD